MGIKKLGDQMPESSEAGYIEVEGTIIKQNVATCFRCSTIGSTNTKRQQTTTYIPSFKLPADLIEPARKLVPASHKNLITEEGVVQIYVASMYRLLPDMLAAEKYGILYQPAMKKDTVSTMPDPTQFKKRTDTGKTDNGKYAATLAKYAAAKKYGCEASCLLCDAGPNTMEPLIKDDDAKATCVTENCASCAALFSNEKSEQKIMGLYSQFPTCERESTGADLVSFASGRESFPLLPLLVAAIVTRGMLAAVSFNIV